MKNSFKPLSQRRPIYPAWQPWSQLPVVMLHAASLRQCPLQLFEQPCPYVPGKHSFLVFWKNKIPSSSLRWFNHYIKVLKLYKFWSSMHSKVLRVKVGFRGYQKYDLVVYRGETVKHCCEHYHFFNSLELLHLFITIICLQFFILSMVNVVFNITKNELENTSATMQIINDLYSTSITNILCGFITDYSYHS